VHPIPLGLCPGPRWGSLQRSPRPPSWFKGAYFQGGKGRERRGGEGAEEVGEGQGTGSGREGVGMPGKGEGREGEGRKERRGREGMK